MSCARKKASGDDWRRSKSDLLRTARQSASAAFTRVSSGDHEFNRLGLTREMSVGAVAAIAVFLWMNSANLGRPAELVKALDPGSMQTLFALAGDGARCQRQGIGALIGLAAKPTGCEMDEMLAPYRDKGGTIGKMANAMSEPPEGMYKWPDGSFRTAAPPNVKLAQVREARCFQTDPYAVGDRGLHAVTEQPRGDVSLPRYLGYNDAAARNVAEAATFADRDLRLVEYFKVRKLMGEVIHRFFGDPGLMMAAQRLANSEHEAAIAKLRERLTDPKFAPALTPLERAELELLVATPHDFVSCTVRRGQKRNDKA